MDANAVRRIKYRAMDPEQRERMLERMRETSRRANQAHNLKIGRWMDTRHLLKQSRRDPAPVVVYRSPDGTEAVAVFKGADQVQRLERML